MSTSRASRIGLPPSSDSIAANSRDRSCMMRAMRKMYLPRSAGFIRDHGPSKAFRAAATALSMSALLAVPTRASRSSVAGLMESNPLALGGLDEVAVDEQPVPVVDRHVIRAFGRRRVLPATVEREFIYLRVHNLHPNGVSRKPPEPYRYRRCRRRRRCRYRRCRRRRCRRRRRRSGICAAIFRHRPPESAARRRS
ncbi:MAG: hypothetical protein U5K76_11060 [Woeseiaceae bacterium]|nr:hypothetical protein [Woeseiaceae bacterium]